ncbi:unnamed protein product, partial [Prorocentrum cordatum]
EAAVGIDARAKCEEYFAASSEFCQPHLVPDTIDALQAKLLEMLDHPMQNDCPTNDGGYMVAAVKDALPFAAGIGRSAAIASGMVAKNMRGATLQAAMQHFTCISPGAMRQLKVKQLIPPLREAGPLGRRALLLAPAHEGPARPLSGRASPRALTKTGTSDQSIDLDFPPWLGPLVGARARGRRPSEPLFSTPAAQVVAASRRLGEGLGLRGLMPHRLRHGGASDDAPSKRQTLAEVKARGRRAQGQSVRRCVKPGMVHQLPGALTP